MVLNKTIQVPTGKRDQMYEITRDIAALPPGDFNGYCLVFSLHTTAGLTINENADPDVAVDMLAQLNRMVPWDQALYRHGEGNSAAHVKASLVGLSVMIPVIDGKLALGTWQGVYFCEFDGPRQRRVLVQFISDGGTD